MPVAHCLIPTTTSLGEPMFDEFKSQLPDIDSQETGEWREALDEIIYNAINESGAESMKDMGKVMALIKPIVTGRADMGAVSQKVKSRLT